MTSKPKLRNPEARKLHEDRAYRLKIFNPKKNPPKEVSIEEALLMVEEEETHNE